MTAESQASSSAELQACLREVEKALRSQEAALAMRLACEAVDKGFVHAHLFVLAAHHNLTSGSLERALDLATRAREMAPRNPDVLNVLGLALARLNRGWDALPIFDAALRQSPGAVTVRFNRGWTLEQLRELKRARTEYERVIEKSPTHVEALVHLAHLAVQRSDLDSARELAERALQQDRANAPALLALASADVQEKKFGDALPSLEVLTGSPKTSAVNRSIALGMMEALEGLGKTAEAFAAWSASKATLRAYYGPAVKAKGESSRERVARLAAYYTTHSGRRDADDTYVGPVDKHVFLVGFPRSGTTLLEQVLASHPDIESLEERDCLTDAIDAFVRPPGKLDDLAALRGEALSHYRERYWKRVAAEGAALKKPVFLDKMPLNSVVLCLVAKLFPQARILFALRDPRDVVFSCFRRRFVITPQMFELTTLEGAAGYYDAVMGLCETYREALGFEFCETRYERLVEDFDSECRRICAFLGIAWSESMRTFAERAREGVINTPSAVQVARGLFTQGIGQWRRYRDHLAPVLPVLAPWVARFGYSED
jgi:tetratricopeptide (TPR) repeat protein